MKELSLENVLPVSPLSLQGHFFDPAQEKPSSYLRYIKSDWSGDTEYPSPEEFDKVLYLALMGHLRQFKIKRVKVFPFNWGLRIEHTRINYNNITTIEVAGIGELNVGLYKCDGRFDFSIYSSFEDYKAGREYNMKYIRVTKESCAKRFGVEFRDLNIFDTKVAHRWYWDGVSAQLQRVPDIMPICYIVEKGREYFPCGWSPKNLSGYATKEECIADNEINVVNFGDQTNESILWLPQIK